MRPRRTKRPSATWLIETSLGDLRRAQSHLQVAAGLVRSVATSIEGFKPDVSRDLANADALTNVVARGLDAHVRDLSDLADPRRGVR